MLKNFIIMALTTLIPCLSLVSCGENKTTAPESSVSAPAQEAETEAEEETEPEEKKQLEIDYDFQKYDGIIINILI